MVFCPGVRPPRAQGRPWGTLSSSQVAKRAGITMRQVLYWMSQGYIAPSARPTSGSGTYARWTEADAQRVAAIADRVRWGMTVEAAARPVNPPLPAPVAPLDAERVTR